MLMRRRVSWSDGDLERVEMLMRRRVSCSDEEVLLSSMYVLYISYTQQYLYFIYILYSAVVLISSRDPDH